MLILFTVTIFTGALLLFVVQPMAGRMLLPLAGGAPAAWNTAMVFFQASLLAGYAYAHATSRWLGVRRQAAVHLVVLLLPMAALPMAAPGGGSPPAEGNPVGWLLGALAAGVGLPFFVVSATSPLLQRWFAATAHRTAGDPYFLYAASNAGSLLALVAYPVLIEPRLGLREQSGCWMAGYGLLAVLTAVCGLWARRTARELPEEEAPPEPIAWRRKLRWVLLALAPCGLMLGVTTHATVEVAPVPLLWVLPLGVYLLSFVLVFARRRWVPHGWMVRALPWTVIGVVAMLTGRMVRPAGGLIGLHLLNLFVVAMVCHGELANDRPSPARLTEFYLWLSAGGALGGVFNALLAPVLFRTVAEYPLALVLACLLVRQKEPLRLLDAAAPVAVGLAAAVLNRTQLGLVWVLAAPAALCLALGWWPVRFGAAVAAVLLANAWMPAFRDRTVHVERSFFGVHRVSLAPNGRFLWLSHGNTIHGVQSLVASQRHEPLAYFTRAGPFGQAFAAVPAAAKQRVGVIGLGAGSLACYAEPGERWRFFEIDPAVLGLAKESGYFHFLPECRGRVEVVLGDARLSLGRCADGEFGMLVLDAYSSDAVPLHLITREALALYRRKTAADGVLIFHISNRHLRLERVLAALASDAGLPCRAQAELMGDLDELLTSGRTTSKWVVMTRDAAVLAALDRDPRWSQPPARVRTRVWTDDYAGVFSVFEWR